MQKILEFLHHVNIKGKANLFQESAEDEWEKNYLESIEEFVPEILETCNKYGIDTLTTFITQKLAQSLKGKTPGDIRSILDIPYDFSEQETNELVQFDLLDHSLISSLSISETQILFLKEQ